LHQERAGTQDRCERRHLAGRSDGAWADSAQLCARRANPADARFAPTRKQLVRERTGHIQRIQKTLEDANIKLDSVISNIVDLSGCRMVESLIHGQADPEALAALADGRLKAHPGGTGGVAACRVTAHHRFMLRLHLD
jgi:hypothetical protein